MEFELTGHQYRVKSMDARAQFHILRKMTPALGGLKSLAGKGINDALKEKSAESEEEKAEREAKVFDALAGFGAELAKLSEDDADFVLFGLLGAVSRKEEKGLGWAQVCTGKRMMYEDIGLADMLHLAGRSAMHNFKDFFQSLLSLSNQQGQIQKDK